VDVTLVTPIGNSPGFAVDSAGNTYLAGACTANLYGLCIEKLTPTGSGIGYLVENPAEAGIPQTAVDASGDLFVASANMIFKLNASGTISATTSESGFLIALDPAGNLQVALQSSHGPVYIRRYSTDLSQVLFETPLGLQNSRLSGMSIGAAGVTTLWGTSYSVNLAQLHPTQACHSGSSALLSRIDNNGTLLESTYLNVEPDFVVGSSIQYNLWGAELLFAASAVGDWQILQLGPTTTEANLSCIGNAASLQDNPIAPNEIVSPFGAGILSAAGVEERRR
jgi:hypothetical protein